MNIYEKIANEEGFRRHMYKCPADKWTIGYGFNLEALKMPQEVADLWLNHIVVGILAKLSKHDWFMRLTGDRIVPVADMAYQMGINGLLGFKGMIAALEAHDYETAANELLDSKYARQTPARAKRNADIIRTGEI